MNDPVVPKEQAEEPTTWKQVWTHHYVVHIELHKPIQKGDHKRSYLRYNVDHDEFTVGSGFLELPRIGFTRERIPIDNVITIRSRYVYIPDFDDTGDWEYEPCEGSIEAEHPVGVYVRTNVDGSKQVIGQLYEAGEIGRFPLK
jgi:hypothetical protein